MRRIAIVPNSSSWLACVDKLFILVVALAASAPSVAQSKYEITTAILPTAVESKIEGAPSWTLNRGPFTVQDNYNDIRSGKEMKKTTSVLIFNSWPLPQLAAVTRLQLRLARQDEYPGALTVRVVPVSCLALSSDPHCPDPTNLEMSDASHFSSSKVKELDGAWDAFNCVKQDGCEPQRFVIVRNPLPGYNFMEYALGATLVPGESKTGRSYYYSANPNDASPNTAQQPRLLVTYTLPSASGLTVSEWQSDGWAAVRSDRRQIGGFSSRPIPFVSNGLMGAPAAFASAIYVLQKRRDPAGKEKMFLEAHALDTASTIWAGPVSDDVVPDSLLIVNDLGRLLVLAGKQLIVYDLAAGNPKEIIRKNWPQLPRPQSVVEGPDGSFYIAGEGQLFALSSDLRMLWSRPIGVSPAPQMTVSPGGQFLYVAGSIGSAASGLIAVNAQTGKAVELNIPGGTQYFQKPVVVRRADGVDTIFIAANSLNTGTLICIHNSAEIASEAERGVADGDLVAHLDQVYQLSGLASQPILDYAAPGDLSSKYLYYVRNSGENRSALVKVRALDGTLVSSLPVSVSADIWATGNPVMLPGGLLLVRTDSSIEAFETLGENLRKTLSLPANYWNLFLSARGGRFYESDNKGTILLRSTANPDTAIQ
jgi:hypothetical protein